MTHNYLQFVVNGPVSRWETGGGFLKNVTVLIVYFYFSQQVNQFSIDSDYAVGGGVHSWT